MTTNRLLLLGDSIIDSRAGSASFLKRMMDLHVERGSQATIALEKVKPEEVHRYGIIQPGTVEGDVVQITDLIEKFFGW